MFRNLLLAVFFLVATPVVADIFYYVPATYPNPEILVEVDSVNRTVVISIGQPPPLEPIIETLVFLEISEPGKEFLVTPYEDSTYMAWRYEYAPDDYRSLYALAPPESQTLPHQVYSELELKYTTYLDPFVFQGLYLVYRTPSPVQTATFTREQLQTTGGIATISGIGDITIPQWASLALGAEITIEGDNTNVDLDGLTPLSNGFSLTAPEVITQLSVEFDADPGDKTIVALVRRQGAALDDIPFPWAVVEAVGRVLVTGGQNLVSGLRKFVILPLQGYDCDYSHPAQLSGGTIVTTVYKSESCEAEPWWIPDVVAGADEARLWAVSEQFQLDPVQKFIALTGGTAPVQASSIDGVVYLNRPFLESIPSVLKRKGVIYHEMAHSMMDYLLPDSLFSRNRHIEATATAAEQRIKPENTSWIDRYPTWSATDVERGLNGIFNPNADGMYNPFFVLDMYRRFPERNILKDFYALGAPDFITGNGIAAWMASLQVTYTELQTLFGEAVSICHQNISPMQNVFGLCGDGTLAIDPFNGPTQIQVGETIIWQHPGGDATVHIEGNPNAPTDSLVTMMAAGDPNGWSVSFDGFLTGDYPLANLPADDYAITATSLEGVNYGTPDEYVTVEIERDAPCNAGGPELFSGTEFGRAYDMDCNVYGPSVQITAVEETWSCEAPGVTRGIVTFEHWLPRFNFGIQWPYTVIGDTTGGAIPLEHWPTAWTPGTIYDVPCPDIGVHVWGHEDEPRDSYAQYVSWVWDCEAAGNCYQQGMRPPVW